MNSHNKQKAKNMKHLFTIVILIFLFFTLVKAQSGRINSDGKDSLQSQKFLKEGASLKSGWVQYDSGNGRPLGESKSQSHLREPLDLLKSEFFTQSLPPGKLPNRHDLFPGHHPSPLNGNWSGFLNSNSILKGASDFTDGAHRTWERHYMSGLAPGYDVATDMAMDNAGSIFVTGYSTSATGIVDYLTIKYDAFGAKLWSSRYDGDGDDFATAIETDWQGNVYVTGYSLNSWAGYDYLTLKYDSHGNELWSARYNSPGNGEDYATALGVDARGNVYVTGYSFGSEIYCDYVTVKYSASGVQQWAAIYDGPENGDDYATALIVAGDNVYVTGATYDRDEGCDYATIKYSSSGSMQWLAYYNGPAWWRDYARALAVDDMGNIYVTGESTGDHGSFAYATVKYDSTGRERWIARYSGFEYGDDYATAIAVDNMGKVYVTGRSWRGSNKDDFATIMYDSSGVEQWAAWYNGPESLDDGAVSISSDNAGNVYITGYSWGSGTRYDYATIKYNSLGEEQWISRYAGPGNDDLPDALVVDSLGSVYVAGYTVKSEMSCDYATVKYDSLGAEQWVSFYNGPGGGSDYASSMAVDKAGNVWVGGYSLNFLFGNDYAIVKYNTTGQEQWTARYNGPGNGDDRVNSLVADSLGNVYVTGRSEGLGTGYDYATMKFNSLGEEQWITRYNGPANFDDQATAIAVDYMGNVYVTGYSYGTTSAYDYVTIKYDVSGVEQWIARYEGPGIGEDWAYAIALDNEGNVYVTGESRGMESHYDYATVKYSPSGEQEWVARYNGPGNGDDVAKALALDRCGNIYVTGKIWNGVKTDDFGTIKYNSSGVAQWTAWYNTSINREDEAIAVTADEAGNVYVTGQSSDLNYSEFTTIKYDSSGTMQWAESYSRQPNSKNNSPISLAVDDLSNVYVTGYTRNPGYATDIATVKYDQSGTVEWVECYNFRGDYQDFPCAVKLDQRGNVYVAGFSSNQAWSIFTTIKYQQTPAGITEAIFSIPNQFELSQNYPNPFNPNTTISYSLSRNSDVELAVYDLLGRKVRTLVKRRQPAGSYAVRFEAGDMPSGIYLCRLTCGKNALTHKMLLVR